MLEVLILQNVLHTLRMSFLLIISSCLSLSCNNLFATQGGTCQIITHPDTTLIPFVMPYQINDPDTTFTLHKDLKEISGLGFTPDHQFLLAVQDEKGKAFFLDPETGKVNKKVTFWKDGDYEGIEVVSESVFVVKSSGTLYEFKLDADQEPETIKYNGFLNGDYDVEGLAFDAQNNRLLLACKAASGADTAEPTKSIYAFRLADSVFERDPAYCLRKSDVLDYLGLAPMLRKMDKNVSFFDPDRDGFDFSPSALAIHPETTDIYILSSVGKMLMIIGQDGTLKHIEKLSKKKHQQPEGIAFAQNGTLYISNEAGNEKPVIHKFRYQKEDAQ